MHRIGELLRRRRAGIVGRLLVVVRLVAVGAPVPLVGAGFDVEDDDAAVAVAVGDEDLVRGLVDLDVGRPAEQGGVVAAAGRARPCRWSAGLAVPRELEDGAVVVGRCRRSRRSRRYRHGCRARWRPTAWSARKPQPWMKLPSASNSMTDGAGTQHLLRGGFKRRAFLVVGESRGRCSIQTWSSGPTATLADLAQQPVVGQRLGPERIDLELRRVGGDGGRGERDSTHQGDQCAPYATLHRFLRRSCR